MSARNNGLFLLVSLFSLSSCTTPMPRLSLDKPPSYEVIGPIVEGRHCVHYLKRVLPWSETETYPAFSEAVQDALEQAFPRADGLIDAEFFFEDNGPWGMQCILVRGIPVTTNPQ